MTTQETIWTGTYYHVELRTGFKPLGRTLSDWYCIVPASANAGSRYVTNAARVGQKYVDPDVTAKAAMVAAAQKLDADETWLTAHPGMLVNLSNERGGDNPPADS
jgi:hypothetical protein